jgi:acetate---CoA ligase (ADP-forming)
VHRLLHPRSIAIVGASERPSTYSSETLLNLRRLGFEGDVWGVNPRRSSVYGLPCFASLSDLPDAPDAVVVAIPAPGVPAVIEEAGAIGSGGAVVYAAGFGESEAGVGLEQALREAAGRYSLPVCGPNCDGLVSLWSRAALWGDALAAPEPGHVALVSQSGNLVVNALATRRGLRLHTAVSSGNEAVVTTPDWVEHLAREPGVYSIALLVEAEGDGARLCEALAVCAEEGVGVAVLKVGASARGAAAAAAHTGAVAGDHRVFRALMEEAGAAWAFDVHELLELAKAFAVRDARPRGGGLAILTCSGGDSGLGADEADRLGLDLPALSSSTVESLRARLPAAATVANPLDYTAMIWGDVETLRDLVRTVGEDPAIGHVLVFYDRPPGIAGHSAESWDAVEEGILAGAAVSPVPVMAAATLPELLDDAAAWRFAEAGVPAIAGLRTGVAVAAALAASPGQPRRLREIAAFAERRTPGRWLAEHEAKELLRRRGVPVVAGRLAINEDDAVAAFHELGERVALKLSSPAVQHKTPIGGIALDVRDEAGVREAFRRLGVADCRISTVDNPMADPASPQAQFEPQILIEEMTNPGDELFVAVRYDAVVPVLVIGRGGTDVERHDDVEIIPLPTPRQPDIVKAADGLALLECNPVIGGVVVDATAQEVAP